eukprot:CAMPEP_0194268680 /NCGR_PEP_ID=MMETSP0169-20130528/2952_1 /TAXON_ID=218684 /ORGANISM="Corethron pennatum, Strain L29A3" /LENGTH=710 /DNA_ID=CAMNT_0039009993 /DNA_START=371 /DNA_END=2503 /DNA_ORIENTATION=-
MSPNKFRNEPLEDFFSPGVKKLLHYPHDAYTTALFPALDGDGMLDYFYNNHYNLIWKSKVSAFPKTETTYVYGKIVNLEKNGRPQVKPIRINFNLTDPKHILQGGGNVAENRYSYDSHGGFILDLDNDGYLDLYMNNGGGRGIGTGPRYGSVLFWGSQNVGGAKWTLSGGILAAFDANLENLGGDGRGRFAYAADFNGDGLIDVVMMNEQRLDGLWKPSQVMYNGGNRTFYADNNFKEYVSVAIYTNNSGKKGAVADSFIVQRGKCDGSLSLIDRKKCTLKKRSSWAVYKYLNGRMNLVFESRPEKNEALALNIQTEDVDGDGIMDFMVPFGPALPYSLSEPGLIKLYYSSSGNKPVFPSKASEKIIPPKNHILAGGAIMRDFDLDGSMDILVVYTHVKKGEHSCVMAMYSKIPGAIKPPFYKMFKTTRDIPRLTSIKERMCFRDISSVDYNSDGFMDITFSSVKAPYLYQLTNIFPSQCSAPNYLAIALQADGHNVNKYGIGSSISLEVSHKKTGKVEEFFKTVSSYSHATSSWGGASDYRIVFGLGSDYIPTRLIVKWPDGKETSINRGLNWRINNIKRPLNMEYPSLQSKSPSNSPSDIPTRQQCAVLNKEECDEDKKCFFGLKKEEKCSTNNDKFDYDCSKHSTQKLCKAANYCSYTKIVGCIHKCDTTVKRKCKKATDGNSSKPICKFKFGNVQNPCFKVCCPVL